MSSGELRINAPQVVHETIDGETILIHLGTGVYYSLEGSGALAWELIAAGAAEDQLVADARSRYDGDGELIGAAIGALVGELIAEGLVVELPDAPVSGAVAPAVQPGDRVPFAPPALNRYTDMQQFMLVDPIHDVEEQAGWPHVKAG